MSKRKGRKRQPNTVLSEGVYDAALDGYGVDPDESMFRRLTGSRGKNLPEFKQERMLGVATYLERTNPVANRLISMLADFVCGEGLSLSFKNAQVQEVLEAHWRDPYNDWERNGAAIFEGYLVTGELLMPLTINQVSGHLRVGNVQVDVIKKVHTLPENWRIPTAVELTDGLAGQGTTYTVVNVRDEDEREALRKVSNPALFWARGNKFGVRGISILYSIADFIELLDQLMFSEVERWLMQKAFVYDVSVEDADDAMLQAMRQKGDFVAPKPGEVRAHNSKVTWQAINPKLEAADAAEAVRLFRNHVLGAVGIPEHWYAEGGDVNRAVGTTMAEPARKHLERLQREWRGILTDVLQAQVDYAVLYGELPVEVKVEDDEGEATDEMVPARDAFEILMPDLSPDDSTEVVTALETLTRTLALAIGEEFISKNSARKLWLMTAGQLGMDFDADDEMEAIEAEAPDEEELAMQAYAVAQGQPPRPQLQAVAGREQERVAD